jgi:cell division protein FtsZ
LFNKITKLTDFPFASSGYGRKIAVLGVGSAGCRIANQLSKESKLLEHFVYVTCDNHDVANVTKGDKILVDPRGRDTPLSVRGSALSRLPEIRRSLSDARVVLLIAGLGGSTGSGIAPLVAREAIPKDAVTVAVLLMPFNYESSKHFFAGAALRQLKNVVSGVILVDNDMLLVEKLPIIDAFSLVNQEIAFAFNKLLGSGQEQELSIGLKNVVNFASSNTYSVLSLGRSDLWQFRQAVLNAVEGFEGTVDKREAAKSLVHLCADKSVTFTDVVSSIGPLSGVLGNGSMQIEYGLSANSSVHSTAIIMASGFTTTKYDNYDPVRCANLEEDLDCVTGYESLLPNLETE